MLKNSYVFIDTDAFVSLHFHKHSNYSKAEKIAEKLAVENAKLITSTYSLAETATVINMYFGLAQGPKIVERIINNPGFKVIKGDKFLSKGLDIMKLQKSKNVSLTDCVNFAIAHELGVENVFSFDKHWRKNGFRLLLRE